jgi:hypothetical protein
MLSRGGKGRDTADNDHDSVEISVKKRIMYKAQRNLGQMPKPRPDPRLQMCYSGACVCLGWWGIVMVSLEISGKLKKTQKHGKIQIHG